MSDFMPWDDRTKRRLKLRDLDVLLAVVETGSMGKAAKRLNISQPAVSKAVVELEDALGVRLMDRSRRGVVPTLYGLALAKHSVAIFNDLRQGVGDRGGLPRERTRTSASHGGESIDQYAKRTSRDRPLSHRPARLHAKSCLAKSGAQGVACGFTQCTNADRADHPEEPDAHPPRSAIYRECSRLGEAAGKTAADLIQVRVLPCHLTPNRHVSHFCSDRFEQRFDPALRDSTRDEDDAACAIIRRPALEPGGRVKHVLDAVDHRRPVGALRHIHDALEAQEIGAAMLGERFEK